MRSFRELYDNVKVVMNNSYLIVFSDTDLNVIKKNCKEQSIQLVVNLLNSMMINVIKKNCKEQSIQYERVNAVDLQEILYDLSTDEKHKSNLKDYAKNNGINHNLHIPESDCMATFELYKDLLFKYGEEFLKKYYKQY